MWTRAAVEQSKSRHMKHTLETKHRAMLLEPRFLVGWAFGHNDADIVTLMEDGSVRSRDAVLQTIRNFRMLWKNETTKSKVQGCLACEHGINVSHGRKHKRC